MTSEIQRFFFGSDGNSFLEFAEGAETPLSRNGVRGNLPDWDREIRLNPEMASAAST